jgi:hypothetical protein
MTEFMHSDMRVASAWRSANQTPASKAWRSRGQAVAEPCPVLTALGLSPEEAAENARLTAIALLPSGPRPTTLIVFINRPVEYSLRCLFAPFIWGMCI